MATPVPIQVQPDLHLPPTLDWYRQAASWLVSLATGALGIGLATADKIQLKGSFQIIVVCLTVGAFLVSVGSGILFYFRITYFAHCLEQRDKWAYFHRQEVDLVQKAHYLNHYTESHVVASESQQHYNWPYQTMLLSFVAAVIGMVLLLFSLLFMEPPVKPAQRTIFTQSTPTQSQTFMMDETTGETWLLTSDTSHVLMWKEIQMLTIPGSPKKIPVRVINSCNSEVR